MLDVQDDFDAQMKSTSDLEELFFVLSKRSRTPGAFKSYGLTTILETPMPNFRHDV